VRRRKDSLSLLVEEGSQSTLKHRLIFYAPILHSIHSVLFDTASIHSVLFDKAGQIYHRIDKFQSIDSFQSIDKSFSPSGSLHCSDPAYISQTPCKTAVFPARSQVHCGAARRAVKRSDRRFPLAGGGLPPVANLLAWNPTLLTYIWTC
jgi:hypothetical protein